MVVVAVEAAVAASPAAAAAGVVVVAAGAVDVGELAPPLGLPLSPAEDILQRGGCCVVSSTIPGCAGWVIKDVGDVNVFSERLSVDSLSLR